MSLWSSAPVRGAPGAPYKGKPRAQARADVGAGVARTVATTGLLTASVITAWHVQSVFSCALLPVPHWSAAWRPVSLTKWPRPIGLVARRLPRDCRAKTYALTVARDTASPFLIRHRHARYLVTRFRLPYTQEEQRKLRHIVYMNRHTDMSVSLDPVNPGFVCMVCRLSLTRSTPGPHLSHHLDPIRGLPPPTTTFGATISKTTIFLIFRKSPPILGQLVSTFK